MTLRDFTIRDIHMALDGEMPVDEQADFTAWLDANPDMKALRARLAADRDALVLALAGVADEPVPDAMLAALGDDMGSRFPRSRWWQAAAAAVLLIVGGGAGFFLGTSGLAFGDKAGDRLAEGAIAAHEIYSNEKRHAVEVAASDSDHLGSWLSNRIGVTLVLPDLSAEGFELLGGRLLPAGDSTAALLLYEDKSGERVSVYVTGDATTKSKGTYESGSDGTTAIYWLDQGYGCAIVGLLPQDRLNAVARDAWRQLVTGLKV